MMKEGGFGDSDMGWKHKDQYERYMRMYKGAQIPEFSPGGVPVSSFKNKPNVKDLETIQGPNESQITEETT